MVVVAVQGLAVVLVPTVFVHTFHFSLSSFLLFFALFRSFPETTMDLVFAVRRCLEHDF